MSEEPAGPPIPIPSIEQVEPIEPPSIPPPPYRWSRTLFFALGAVVLLLWMGWGRLTRTPLENLYYPVDTPLWFVDQDMILHDALKPESFLIRLVQPILLPSSLSDSSEAILREAIEHAQRSPTPDTNVVKLRAHLIILLSETREFWQAEAELKLLDDSEPSRLFAQAVRQVYKNKMPLPGTTFREETALLETGWAYQRFNARLESLAGQNDASHSRMHRLNVSGERLKEYVIFVSIVMLGLVAAGLCFGFNAVKNSWLTRSNQGPFPWSLEEGVGIFVRSVLFGGAVYMGLYLLLSYYPVEPLSSVFIHARAFLLWCPVLFLVSRRWAGQKPWQMFGIDPGNPKFTHWVKMGMLLFALDFCANGALWMAHDQLRVEPHWTEGLDEWLLYGEKEGRVLGVLDSIISAPVLEELLFRGLLFGGLRRRLSFWPAALISGFCFAGVHFYSWPAFSGVLIGAVLSSYFYERTGSLIPAIIAHSLINLFWVWPMIWIYGI